MGRAEQAITGIAERRDRLFAFGWRHGILQLHVPLLAGGASLSRSGGLCDRLVGVGRSLLRVLRRLRDEAESLAQLVFDLVADVGMFLKEETRIFAALPEALTLVGNPSAGFLEDILGHAEIDQVALFRDAFTVDDVELSFAE